MLDELVPRDTFTFNGTNSLDYGIKVIAKDVLKPRKRTRKLEVPLRNGLFDLGAMTYEERTISIECYFERDFKNDTLPRHIIREVAYWLSTKSRLFLWNEPDKYYMAELFDSEELETTMREAETSFVLDFIAEPFAISREEKVLSLQKGTNSMSYTGTAVTPTYIRIKNNGTSSINSIKFRLVKE